MIGATSLPKTVQIYFSDTMTSIRPEWIHRPDVIVQSIFSREDILCDILIGQINDTSPILMDPDYNPLLKTLRIPSNTFVDTFQGV